jgi:hypothetical protein
MTDQKKEIEDLEDSEVKEALLEVAEMASSKAVRSSKALGLTIHIIRDHQVIAIHPDHKETVIRTVPPSNIDVSHLKKGSVLKRKNVSIEFNSGLNSSAK